MLPLAALLTLLNGCSQTIEPQVPPVAMARIQRLASICREFAASQKKQAANMDEVKAWAKKLPKDKLDWLKIDDVEEAFVSPRDQQPYALVRGAAQKPGPMMIQAYEKVGEKGKRYVVTTTGSVLELEEAAFKQVMSNTP
jgi:hypothetical protein